MQIHYFIIWNFAIRTRNFGARSWLGRDMQGKNLKLAHRSMDILRPWSNELALYQNYSSQRSLVPVFNAPVYDLSSVPKTLCKKTKHHTDICCCAARSCYYCNIVSQRSPIHIQAKRQQTNRLCYDKIHKKVQQSLFRSFLQYYYILSKLLLRVSKSYINIQVRYTYLHISCNII